MGEEHDLSCALYLVAKLLEENQSDEATAVKGYTEQLQAIARAQKIAGERPEENAEILSLLENLRAATEEKISDELNHQKSLLDEFVALSGIKIAED